MLEFRLIYLTTMLVCCLTFPISTQAFTDFVSNETQFSESINKYNLETISGEHFIVLTGNILLTSQLADISNTSGTPSLTIDGNGKAINGNNAHSVFSIDKNSKVTISNLMIIFSKDVNSAAVTLLETATLNFVRSTAFDNNTANGVAGAIHVGSTGATLNVIESTFSGNLADTNGGAIYSVGTTNVFSSTFTGNSADSGGAIWSNDLLTIRGSTFCDNASTVEGGAIFSQDVSGSIADIHFSTLTSNTSPSGGNIHANSTLGTLNIESILLNGGTCVGAADTILGVSVVPSNIAADTCGLSATIPARIVEPNPMLGPLQYNGGQTETLALLPGSAAIDQVTTNAIDTNDQRGIPRPQGATSDIGSFEFIPADQLEENDSFGTAAEILPPMTVPLLSIDDSKNNELDWYKFQLVAGTTATITVSFLHDLGDIDISLVDESLVEIGFGDSVTDNEVIKFKPTVSGTYYLQVLGFDNARNLYGLDISIPEDQTCFPVLTSNGKVAIICF